MKIQNTILKRLSCDVWMTADDIYWFLYQYGNPKKGSVRSVITNMVSSGLMQKKEASDITKAAYTMHNRSVSWVYRVTV